MKIGNKEIEKLENKIQNIKIFLNQWVMYKIF